MHRSLGKFDRFDAINLVELEERSKLLKRNETKYLVHKNQLFSVIDDFIEHYDILEINGNRLFHYDSCYFDTEERWAYLQHHQGKRLRSKIRTRAYLHDDHSTYFEVKLKKQGQTYKYRYPIQRSEH